ncbi:MAG: hypothetical protein K2X35_16440 [Bryobacteraceae bacterium]|nr:hypothetical protein [Bryobacteraceae bacterium]
MTLKEQLEERERMWRSFHEWERRNPPPMRSFDAVLRDLDFLLTFISPEEILRDPDPEKNGIQKMRAALALLKRHD